VFSIFEMVKHDAMGTTFIAAHQALPQIRESIFVFIVILSKAY
jgi:hypothetical protein